MRITKEYILSNQSASYWIKDAVIALDDRDPVDALKDVQVLEAFLKDKLGALLTDTSL